MKLTSVTDVFTIQVAVRIVASYSAFASQFFCPLWPLDSRLKNPDAPGQYAAASSAAWEVGNLSAAPNGGANEAVHRYLYP